MKWLQATLAFALTMLVLATVVTIVLESCYRLARSREKGFKLMLTRLFDDVLAPQVMHLLDVSPDQARRSFVDTMARNEAFAAHEKPGFLRSRLQSGELASMTMLQFADRLADTDVGRAIARQSSARIEQVIEDLAQKFERFGGAVSQRYEGQARSWCVVASILLAFGANVDAVRVFQSLLEDEGVREQIIATYGDRISDTASRPQSLQSSIQGIAASPDRPADPNVRDELDVTTQAVEQPRREVLHLRDAGLPMAFAAWPYCGGSTSQRDSLEPPDPLCRANGGASVPFVSWRGLGWFFSVLLAGLLIGLGAPFWFDLARGLTRGAQLLRAVGAEDKTATAAPAREAGARGTPVHAFNTAIAAARVADQRAHLAPDGSIAASP